MRSRPRSRRCPERCRVSKDLAVARQGITAALAGDVSWPRVLEDLAGTLPEGVWLTTLSLQPAAAGAPPTAAPDPGAGAAIGTASFGATAARLPRGGQPGSIACPGSRTT